MVSNGIACVLVLAIGGCSAIPGHVVSPERRAWTVLRDQHVVRQALDYSCGAASVATILRHHFGHPVDEQDVITTLERYAPAASHDERRLLGYSLLELRQAAVAMGYRATGVRLSVDALATLDIPVIVYLEGDRYRHFAVARGIIDAQVLLADPSVGNVTMPLERFTDLWNGVSLVIEDSAAGSGSTLALDAATAQSLQETGRIRRTAITGALRSW